MGELGGDFQDGVTARRDTRDAEPSMEDILSSIKRIIAEDGEAAVAERRERKPTRTTFAPRSLANGEVTCAGAAASSDDDVLELNESMAQEDMPPAQPVAADPAPEVEPAAPVPTAAPSPLVSSGTATASRSSLDALSRLVVRPEVTGSDTLEGMVRDMLRPMLSDWLDANLPRLVETMVAREISRITSGQAR